MPPRTAIALFLSLWLPLSAQAAGAQEPIKVSAYHDSHGHSGVLFTLPHLPLDRNSLRIPRGDVQAILAAFEKEYGKQAPLPPIAFVGPPRVAGAGKHVPVEVPPEWQLRLRMDFEQLYGTSQTGLLPPDFMNSPFIQALRLSPQYMVEGVRESAAELFTSPTFIASMGLSMILYMAALVAPEPFLSKGTVAAITFYLMWVYGATEVLNVARAVVRLYEEAQAARTLAELEEAARYFGMRIGGVALRVGVVAAMGRLAGKLPEVPKAPGGGGLWTRLGTPRAALACTVTLEGTPVVQTTATGASVVVGETARAEASVANGTILFMGALLGTEASATKAAINAARMTGGCRADNSRGDSPEHHIATNKNGTAEVRGGPWTPQFEALFKRADMDLNHPANRIFVFGHKGPHPEEYHLRVYRRLRDALTTCAMPQECRPRLIDALDELADDICKSGSRLNKLVTKQP